MREAFRGEDQGVLQWIFYEAVNHLSIWLLKCPITPCHLITIGTLLDCDGFGVLVQNFKDTLSVP